MLPKDIIKKIKLIDIKTRLLVEEMFSGEYHSVFKGRGIEFSEVREYSYGDDIRTIDWNVTARFGKPFVKIFEEERELTLLILFDMSSSTLFGSQENTKRDYMVELATLFAFAATKNNDRVGAVIFTDQIEEYIPPGKEQIHALRILREFVYHKPQGIGTSLRVAFDFINHTHTRKSIILLLSDFFDTGYDKSFKMMAKRHDVIPIVFNDPLESFIIENRGLFSLKDLETGKNYIFDLSDPSIRTTYKRNMEEMRLNRNRLFTSTGLDYVSIETSKPYIKPLVDFFHRRSERL